MRLAWRSCAACASEWEELDRRLRPFCSACGSKRVETLLFGGEKRAPDFSRVPRGERIDGLGFVLGIAAYASARDSGDWDYRKDQGDDPDDLEAEYWLDAYRAKADKALANEEIVLAKDEEDAAATAFRAGWDWAGEDPA
ncbi:hypothetical protein BH09MYX1_BH09MYX1_36340 [soil metagenome]